MTKRLKNPWRSHNLIKPINTEPRIILLLKLDFISEKQKVYCYYLGAKIKKPRINISRTNFRIALTILKS